MYTNVGWSPFARCTVVFRNEIRVRTDEETRINRY